MKVARWVPLMLVVCATACATNPPPQIAPPQIYDAAEYRKALETARAELVASEQTPVNVPRVDVEAAAAIPIPDHRSIRDALAYFITELRSDIQDSLIRSARYKKLIDEVLDQYKLPKALAYLPVIESAYLPTLTSRAGAHGIWQFMPETAREYGLRVDWWVDERADPDRSTRAAAAYLNDLYRHFHDWPLALAAYNAGPRRIERALADTRSNSFWDLLELAAIPRETRGYVPTFFATLMIVNDPVTYGFRLGDASVSEARWVELDGPLSLRFVAEVGNVDEGVLRDLNPALRRGMVPPGKSMVRVPVNAAEGIEARAATLKNEDANIAVCSYTLREGDSIKRLARALGTSAQMIQAMNHLHPSTHLRRGDTIYLPVRARQLGARLAGRRKPRPGEHTVAGGGM
jgi:peptidoglycan lytic transglycosylase D